MEKVSDVDAWIQQEIAVYARAINQPLVSGSSDVQALIKQLRVTLKVLEQTVDMTHGPLGIVLGTLYDRLDLLERTTQQMTLKEVKLYSFKNASRLLAVKKKDVIEFLYIGAYINKPRYEDGKKTWDQADTPYIRCVKGKIYLTEEGLDLVREHIRG